MNKHIVNIFIIIMVAICIFLVAHIYLFFSSTQQTAIEDGKMASIDLSSGKILMRDLPKEEKKDVSKSHDPLYKNRSGKGSLAIMFVNVGLNEKTDNAIAKLDKYVSVSISPYSKNIIRTQNKLKDAEHEVFLDLPMQTESSKHSNNGPFSLLVNAPKAQNMIRLSAILESTNNYMGVVVTPSEIFTHSISATLPIINALQKRNIAIIYNENVQNSFLSQEAKKNDLRIVNQYTVIDDVLIDYKINEKLHKIQEVVKKQGKHILVIARPYPISISAIQKWLKTTKIVRASSLIE